LLIGTLGLANMWEAVFADVGVAVIGDIAETKTMCYHDDGMV
jgi:hypothetical protein